MSDLVNFSDVDISPVSGQGGAMLLNPKVGFELGWDYAMHGLHRDGELPGSFQKGFAAGKEHAGRRHLKSDAYTRKWLQVRYNAWLRGRAVDDAVTPDFFARIDCSVCPVTGVALTKGAMAETDWSIDRLNNDGAYAVGNLAVMSVKANHAKADKSFTSILDCVQASEDVDGLSPGEWLRMAVMCVSPCLEGTAEGELTAILPLIVPPRPYVPVHDSQHAQYLLATQAPGGKGTVVNRMRELSPSPEDRKTFIRMLKRLRKCGSHRAPFAVWEDKRTFELFRNWYLSLTPDGHDHLHHLMGLRGGFEAMPSGYRGTWRLSSKGYA